MKNTVQAKINHMRDLAAGSTYATRRGTQERRGADSLGQAVRNQKEADQFMADLDAAFNVAGKKKK